MDTPVRPSFLTVTTFSNQQDEIILTDLISGYCECIFLLIMWLKTGGIAWLGGKWSSACLRKKSEGSLILRLLLLVSESMALSSDLKLAQTAHVICLEPLSLEY